MAEQIQTVGKYSPGLTIQSVGGGGGFALVNARSDDETRIGATDSKSNSGSGAAVLTNSANITTFGEVSPGVVVQSVAGGGGFVGDMADGALSLGINGAGIANAGNITVNNTGDISTHNRASSGFIAQSVAVYGTVSASNNTALYLGSMMGKEMGEGGDIEVFNSGNIATDGKGSIALLVQSLGGVVATMLSHR